MFGAFNVPLDGVKIEQSAAADVEEYQADDIVEIITKAKRPVLSDSHDWDQIAQLRLLGTRDAGGFKQHLMLVTEADSERIVSTYRITKQIAAEFDVESRFVGCDGVVVSEYHLRRVVLRQDGRFCDRCSEYNLEAKIPRSEAYVCRPCRENPWR